MGRRSGRLFRRLKKKQQKNGPHAKRSVFGSESEVTWLPLRRRELRPS